MRYLNRYSTALVKAESMPEYGLSMWIDSHAHLSDPRFCGRLERDLLASKTVGISHWVLGGVGPEDWKRQLELKTKFPNQLTLCFGLHPWWISEHDEPTIEKAFQELETMLSSATLFGELGIDGVKRFKVPEIQAKQERWFLNQLDLIEQDPKPLVLHVVREHEKVLKALELRRSLRGLVHSFSGSWETAKRYLDLGYLISFSANITYENHDKVRKAAAKVPLESLLVETDCPDQAPAQTSENHPFNEPTSLITVAKALEALRNENWEEILTQSAKNLKKLIDV